MADRACPCCGYLTLDGVNVGSFENCAVCGWEDDPSARADASVRTSNGISLNEGQNNFNRFGACLEEVRFNVRAPRLDETPADSRETER